ncbi:MAG: hypothetical protein ABI234_19765 [Ktedonobacteraceae bacterium]
MFYIALLLLILVGGTALVITVQNFPTLMVSEHLMFLIWRVPGIPVLLLYLFGAFLGGLLLYVWAAYAARRDAREMKSLRARIIELEKAQIKAPSGALGMNFAPPVVPMPGFSTTGPLPYRQPPSNPLPNFSPTGPLQQGSLLPNLPQPARQFPPQPQSDGLRSPFQQQ